MNFDLTELAATLAIGVFLVVGVVFALIIFSKKTVSEVISLANINQYVIAIIAAFCFVVGMIIEDVSNKFVDQDGWLNRWVVLESDDEIKTKVLFGDNYSQNIHDSPISYLASRYGLLGNSTGADGRAIEGHILREKQCTPNNQTTVFQRVELDAERLREVAKTFYYNAKSVSYSDPSYYNELKRIQMRIDFSRSVVAVSLFLSIFFITVVALIVLLSPIFFGLSKLKLEEYPKLKGGVDDINNYLAGIRETRVRGWRLLAFSLVLGSVYFVGGFANSSEEKEFDKRAYGYFIYHNINSNASLPICEERRKIGLQS